MKADAYQVITDRIVGLLEQELSRGKSPGKAAR